MSKALSEMTVRDFLALPFREDWAREEEFDCIVILPTRRMHDSGYRCMDFVGVRNDKAICRLSGCSDVIHVDGIGGFRPGMPRREGTRQGYWSIDCLAKSGLLRIWTDGTGNGRGVTRVGSALSSFEIFAVQQ